MISIFVHQGGETKAVPEIDPTWLAPGSSTIVWVDIENAHPEEERHLLADVFKFHELAIEDAMTSIERPKVETYDSYVYLVLHGIAFEPTRNQFRTHDIDFFLGSNYLVTHHDGWTRTIAELRKLCPRSPHMLGEGPAALLHRIVDALVDHYRPEVDELEARLDRLEREIFISSPQDVIQRILALKRDVSSLRRITTPQRDVIARLARQEFLYISQQVGYRFRDVYDHLVRLSDEALFFQDRITGILDAHLSNVSYHLNDVMRVLTIISTIFMPLTVLTGMFGMNVELPDFPGGARGQFWAVAVVMLAISGMMLLYFRRRRWW